MYVWLHQYPQRDFLAVSLSGAFGAGFGLGAGVAQVGGGGRERGRSGVCGGATKEFVGACSSSDHWLGVGLTPWAGPAPAAPLVTSVLKRHGGPGVSTVSLGPTGGAGCAAAGTDLAK